jgi:hypothetical protein
MNQIPQPIVDLCSTLMVNTCNPPNRTVWQVGSYTFLVYIINHLSEHFLTPCRYCHSELKTSGQFPRPYSWIGFLISDLRVWLALMWFCIVPFQYRITLRDSDLWVYRLSLCPITFQIRDCLIWGTLCHCVWSAILVKYNPVTLYILFVVIGESFNDTGSSGTILVQPDLEEYSEGQLLFLPN